MDLENFSMLVNEFSIKDPDIVPEEVSLIILDIRSVVCMANNRKDIKHTRHIFRRVNFIRNGEKCKMHKID